MDYNVVSERDDQTGKPKRQYRPSSHYRWQILRSRPRLKGRRVLCMVPTERLMKGMGQAELAERVGVSRQTINNIEINKTMPAIDVALAIAEVLEVDVNSLFMFR